VKIPVVDLHAENERVTADIFSALHEFGFFYVIHHEVDLGLQNQLEEVAREFFESDEEQKMKFRMENAGRAWKGYFPVGAELTSGKPDQKEGFYFGAEIPTGDKRVIEGWPMHGPNQWQSPTMRSIVTAYMSAVQKLAERLMTHIASGLGLAPDYFAKRFAQDPTRLFRIFAYPALPGNTQQKWGVQEHTDMGFLTILKQDLLGGLQAKGPDGVWVDAPPIENSFVVNIGDMLELWTWGILKATLHRVENKAKHNRYSYPFFYDPTWTASLENRS